MSAGARLGDLDAADQALEELARSERSRRPGRSGLWPAPRQAGLRPLEKNRSGPASSSRTPSTCSAGAARRSSAPQARLDLARALQDSGRHAAAAAEAQAALETFERLGAAHGVERATAFLGRLEHGAASRPPAG